VKYRVEFADQARADLHAIAMWIAADSLENAARWLSEIEEAVHALDRMPERCPLAIESTALEGFELRQLVHGNYRILFVVIESCVHVLHVRHAARRPAERARLEVTSGGDLPDSV